MSKENINIDELPYQKDRIVEIVWIVDDETAERTAWVSERLMQMGALHVSATPTMGKKNRLSATMSVISKPEFLAMFVDWILKNSSTFGVRYLYWERYALTHHFETRKMENGNDVCYKIGTDINGVILKEKPEYDSISKYWS